MIEGVSAQAVMAGVGAAVTVIVWLIRLEGRHNAHEAVCAERQKRMDERHENIEYKLDSIDDKLERLVGRP